MSTKSLKIVIVGEAKVGKTSLIQRYVNDIFDHKSKSASSVDKFAEDEDILTADFLEKRVTVDDKEMTVSFWDQPSAASSPPPRSFFAGAHGCCLVFSTIDAESLQKLEFWYDCLKKNCCDDESPPPPIVIAENKIDLIDRSVVDADEVEQAAKQHKLRLYRTSSKQGHQVKELFEYITGKAAKYEMEQKAVGDETPDASGLNLGDTKGRANRTFSTASWTLPLASNDDRPGNQAAEPSKRRTGGVKPLFNKNKCPVM